MLVENLSVPFDRRVWQECEALTGAGYRVEVICPCGTTRDREPFAELAGVRIHRYPLRAATGGPAGYLQEYSAALWRTWRRARALARGEPFAAVHACNPPDLLFLIALGLRGRGTRFLFDHHDLVPELFLSRFSSGSRLVHRLSAILERITFAVADGVISTNESYRRVAIERGRVPPDRVRVVRSAPDLSRFTPVPPDPALKRGSPYLACYLGVMGPQDGVDVALRALAHLHHDLGRTDLHTVFIGSGDAFEKSVALAATLGLDGHVEFTGRIDDDDLRRYLSTADVCLSPDPKNPLNDLSSMNKVVEYMAMGRALVSFDLHEARVTAGDAAVYASNDDEQAFARCIAELLDAPSRRAEMGRLGRARVEESLSWEISRRSLLEAYAELLGRPPRSWRTRLTGEEPPKERAAARAGGRDDRAGAPRTASTMRERSRSRSPW